MMAFSFREFTNLLDKGKRLPEIAKPEAPLDAVGFLRQLPVWGLCVKELSLLAREWRYSPRQGVQVLLTSASVIFSYLSCQPLAAPRLANRERERCDLCKPIPIDGTAMTADAAPNWIS